MGSRKARKSIVGAETLLKKKLQRRINKPDPALKLVRGSGASDDWEDYDGERLRSRTKHAEPLNLSHLDHACHYACSRVVWEISARLNSLLDGSDQRGRPRECSPVTLLIYSLLANQLFSIRQGDRFLADPFNWGRIVESVEDAWPDKPEWRLPKNPPTRFQYMRLREKLISDVPEWHEVLRESAKSFALECARLIGCGTTKDSLTHPSPDNVIYGDATWEPSMFNTAVGTVIIDRKTGEILTPKVDPDALPFHKSGSGPGNYIVTSGMRNDFPHERVLLDSEYKEVGISEGDVFASQVIEMFDELPILRAATHDMGMHPPAQEKIGALGLHVVSQVPKTSQGKVRVETLGQLTFRVGDREFTRAVTVVEGCPIIEVIDIEGEEIVVPLHRRETKLRGTTMYNRFVIPDRPVVPTSMRGASTWIRQFSRKEELEEGKLRSAYLRSIPNNDPDFDPIFGRREDIESMHHDLKSRRIGRRARSLGLQRRELDLRGYQLHQSLIAVVAHSLRTGADLSPYFGRWKPPKRAYRSKAA